MYKVIKPVQLKTGEKVELAVVRGPDKKWGPKLRRLLGHKGAIWVKQVRCSLEPRSGIESYFYILVLKGKPIANIATFERFGIGNFGHVWTVPEQRRKGAANILNHTVIEDFKARGGKALYLGTGYDTHPYHLYRKYGFKGMAPKSGYMYWFREGQQKFEANMLKSGPVSIESFSYKHWPLLPVLSAMKHPSQVRIPAMGILGAATTEGGALPYLFQPKSKKSQWSARVAVSNKSKVPVAVVCVRPFPIAKYKWLDFFAAPSHEKKLPELIDSLKIKKESQLVAIVDGVWKPRIKVLQKMGFEKTSMDMEKPPKLLEAAKNYQTWVKN